jgi:hypothetical protein
MSKERRHREIVTPIKEKIRLILLLACLAGVGTQAVTRFNELVDNIQFGLYMDERKGLSAHPLDTVEEQLLRAYLHDHQGKKFLFPELTQALLKLGAQGIFFQLEKLLPLQNKITFYERSYKTVLFQNGKFYELQIAGSHFVYDKNVLARSKQTEISSTDFEMLFDEYVLTSMTGTAETNITAIPDTPASQGSTLSYIQIRYLDRENPLVNQTRRTNGLDKYNQPITIYIDKNPVYPHCQIIWMQGVDQTQPIQNSYMYFPNKNTPALVGDACNYDNLVSEQLSKFNQRQQELHDMTAQDALPFIQ